MKNPLTLTFPLYKRTILIFASLFLTITLTSACYCEDEERKSAENNVLLLRFNKNNGEFTSGKEYSFFNDTETFTMNLNQEKLNDKTTTTLHYTEMNALLLKSETFYDGASGNILIPEDFRDETTFMRTETTDLISSKVYKVLTGEDLPITEFNEMWLKIQNLSKVRAYLKKNPDQEINIISYHPTIDTKSDSSQWIFVLKN